MLQHIETRAFLLRPACDCGSLNGSYIDVGFPPQLPIWVGRFFINVLLDSLSNNPSNFLFTGLGGFSSIDLSGFPPQSVTGLEGFLLSYEKVYFFLCIYNYTFVKAHIQSNYNIIVTKPTNHRSHIILSRDLCNHQN